MPYQKTDWKARIVERPRTYTIVENIDGTKTLTPMEGNVLQEGTLLPINLNKIEDTIYNMDLNVSNIMNYTLERSNKDDEGIFVNVIHKRSDGTKILDSTLTGGTSPEYTTRTVNYYDLDGSTILKTDIYNLTYDSDKVLIKEELQ